MDYTTTPIEELEGVGTSRGATLREYGITAAEDLLTHPVQYWRRILKDVPGFPTASLETYRTMAKFLQIPDLTGQHAEALVAGGRTSLHALAAPAPSVIVREFDDAVDRGLVPRSVDEQTVVSWQKHALTIAYTGLIRGTVVDEDDGSPIANASVTCGEDVAYTDDTGRFWLPSAPYGPTTVIVRASDYERISRPITVGREAAPTRRFVLAPGSDGREVVESADVSIGAVYADDQFVFVDADPEEFAPETPVRFWKVLRNGRVRLHGVYRRRSGNRIEVPRLTVEATLLDVLGDAGDIYRWRDGGFRRTDESLDRIGAPRAVRIAADRGFARDSVALEGRQ